MILTRLRSIGLGTRIALTMLAAMILIQTLNVAAFFLLPRPPERIYSADWLADRAVEAAQLFSVSRAERDIAAGTLSRTHGLVVLSIPSGASNPVPGPPSPWTDVFIPRSLASLKASIEQRLDKEKRLRVEVDVMRPPPPLPLGPLPLATPPPPPEAGIQSAPVTPMADGATSNTIMGNFRIELTDPAKDRIAVLPELPPRFGWILSPPAITGLLTILLVALLSAWTAKRSLAPLEDLVSAARRMGRERNPSPIHTQNLGDFAVVGEAMNDMQQKIRTFIDDRTQTLGAISHDLRTGLTRLRLGAEEVPDGPGRATLMSAIEDMQEMITATLTFASDDLSGEPSAQADIAAIVITCCDTLADMGHAVTYEGPDHTHAVCQPSALKRAITNIVENAAKYGHEAHVSLESDNSRILITVRDKGPGIPEHLMAEALRPFRRLETSRSRETGGVGLGLTIARDVMSAHGGALRLANQAEGGLEVVLELPRTSLAQAN